MGGRFLAADRKGRIPLPLAGGGIAFGFPDVPPRADPSPYPLPQGEGEFFPCDPEMHGCLRRPQGAGEWTELRRGNAPSRLEICAYPGPARGGE